MDNEEIAKVTLAFIDENGLDAVSFRKISQVTGMATMTICNRFKSKENLLRAALGAMLAEHALGSVENETWDAGLRRVAHHVRNMALAHPKAYWLFLQTPPFEEPVRTLTNEVFSTHQGQSLPENLPYEFLSVMHSFLSGFQIAEGFTNEALAGHPDEAAKVGSFATMFNEESFERDLDVIIAGFANIYKLPLSD